MNRGAIDKTSLFAALPPVWPEDPLPEIRSRLADTPRRLVVLDDDPTGTQTVRDITVVTAHDVDTLRAAFQSDDPGFFILTNSRALPESATRALHAEIAQNLLAAAGPTPFTVASRSDSTLRGHFPAETDVIAAHLGSPDLLVLAPYFEAGGRYTIGDIHYVAEGDQLIPASQTPFARDAAFGYHHAHLPAWVEEKTAGRVRADEVACIPLETIRSDGPDAVGRWLAALPRGTIAVVNAAAPRDIEVVAAALLRLELAGRRVLYRCAASLVAARLGQPPHPPLPPEALQSDQPTDRGGLVVAGSYVPKTTAQIDRLCQRRDIEAVELDVPSLLDGLRRPATVSAAAARINETIRSGRDVLLFTSRALVTGTDAADSLRIGRSVSTALVETVRALEIRPRFLIAKGGITSSDIATDALGIRRARVLGQILPGVPVWRTGSETKFPDMPYIIFPGNVGDADALAEAVARLRDARH